MVEQHDKDSWVSKFHAAWMDVPILAHRVLLLASDGTNPVVVKAFPDGVLISTGGGGGGSGNVTITGCTISLPVIATVTGFLPSITGNVTVTGRVSAEALYGRHVSQGINLTHTSTWTVAISTPTTKWELIKARSTTDVDIQISYDGGTTQHDTIPAGDGFVLDLKSNDLHETSWISIRNDGTTPSRGKVYLFAAGT